MANQLVAVRPHPDPSQVIPPRDEIAAYHLIEEPRLVGALIERAILGEDERRRIADLARRLVHAARAGRHKFSGIDAFMLEYGLTSEEGVILMCLAEALLRIPDADTAKSYATALRGSDARVTAIKVRTSKRNPAPPFTTSTLQQEASRKLGFGPKRTMSVAQRLYEKAGFTRSGMLPMRLKLGKTGGI